MRGTVIVLLLLVTGAASAMARPAKQNPLRPAPQSGHCAVGVVSHIGDKLTVEKGDLVEEQKVSEVPIDSWHLDDLVVDRVRGVLGKRATVQWIPYRKEALATRRLFLRRVPDYAATMRILAADTRCARYILVTEGRRQVRDGAYPGDIAMGKGLGLLLHASIEASVFDGETFKLLDSRVTSALEQSSPPELLQNESSWPDPPNSAAQSAKLREAARKLIAQCLDKILPQLLPTL
jgi:hypothetical protein